MLTPHFSESELDVADAPAGVQAAAYQVALILEDVRAAIGVPLLVTSGYRTVEHNAEVGGVANSQHLTGNAADVLPIGLAIGDAWDRLSAALAAGQVREYGQIIVYGVALPGGKSWGHIHVSTRQGTSSANRPLFAVPDPTGQDTVYVSPSPAYAAAFARGVVAAIGSTVEAGLDVVSEPAVLPLVALVVVLGLLFALYLLGGR
jgi:hypothetical protein